MIAIGLAQVLTLVVFVLLMRYAIDRLTPGTVGAALTADTIEPFWRSPAWR